MLAGRDMIQKLFESGPLCTVNFNSELELTTLNAEAENHVAVTPETQAAADGAEAVSLINRSGAPGSAGSDFLFTKTAFQPRSAANFWDLFLG